MSDRYLYKAKRTDNGEWVKGYYTYYPFGMNDTEETKHVIRDTSTNPGKLYFVDPFTICQCTGLPDKNGNKIWENDIVETSDGTRGVVKFGKYGDMKTDYGFYIEWDKTQPYWRNDICYWQSDIMVIVSIFDNPELLEGGAE